MPFSRCLPDLLEAIVVDVLSRLPDIISGSANEQEMLVRLTLSSLAFHRHHDRGARLALARLVLRATARFWLTRDTLRFHLNRNTGVRERLAQDREVWREVLTRTTE